MRSNKLVFICCKRLDTFRKAHFWALNRGLTSLLLPPAEWPNIEPIAKEFGATDIITDEPNNAHFNHYRVLDALELAAEGPCASQNWPDPVAILFTSGSTGQPKAIVKNARAIESEFELLRSLFPVHECKPHFISTVPLEHMFGYTFAFWLPVLMNADLLEKRIFIPADLKNACAASAAPVWVITTPTHLRAYAQMPGGFENVAGVVSATGPLSTELARAAARHFNTQITEIYGSTETGAIAVRTRTADEEIAPAWTPLNGIQVSRSPSGTAICKVPYLEQSVELGDLIETGGTHFTVLGRTGDLLKIAGKRHSLSALNRLLASAPGVTDSVYYMPEASAPGRAEVQRAAALVVLSAGYSTDDVLNGLRGTMDDVFLPRPIYSVDRIPRTETGKIRNPDLQRIYQSYAKTGMLHLTEEN